jgi:hypothetical protein
MTTRSIELAQKSGFGFVGPVTHGKFYPVLYGVASGTYASSTDNNYGVLQPVQPAIDSVTNGPVDYSAAGANLEFNGSLTVANAKSIQGNTQCFWSRQDDLITFDLCISLNGAAVNPFLGQGSPYELKIKALTPSAQSPQQFNLRNLPLPDPSQDSPWFDAEIVNTMFQVGNSGPRVRYLPTATRQLHARLLKDGTFALITVLTTALQTDTPYASTTFFTDALQAANAAGGGVNLHIRGSYFCGNNYI